jgi:t-SNARE complex subunit (syntaxin)
MNDHDLLIRIDERILSICDQMESMKDDFDERMEEQRATLANVTMLIDDQLTDADKRITRLEKWRTKAKTTYGIMVAILSLIVYAGVTCIIKFWK